MNKHGQIVRWSGSEELGKEVGNPFYSSKERPESLEKELGDSGPSQSELHHVHSQGASHMAWSRAAGEYTTSQGSAVTHTVK